MRKLFLASAAAVALACGATAAIGQAPEAAASSPPATLTAEQQASYVGWPAQAKASYDAWPAEYKAYFWTLTANQQKGWFALSDTQRKQVFDLSPADRTAAWTSIEAQLAGAATPPPPPAADPTATQVQANPTGPGDPSVTPPNPATAGTPVPPAQPADPGYQAGPYKGALTQPPADAQAKDYPVCSKTVTDSCRNRGGK